MKKRGNSITIRHGKGEGNEAGKWFATIDEIPEFRAIADTDLEAVRAASDYANAVRHCGPNPHPLLVQHHNDPSLLNWLACRRAGLQPAFPKRGGMGLLGHSAAELERYGVSAKDFIELLDAQDAAISKVCLLLLESIAQGQHLTKAGETHLASRYQVVPFEIIDWLIHVMLGGLDWYGIEEIPYDLRALIRFRLIPSNSRIEEQRAVLESKEKAIWIARKMQAMGLKPSFRSVAKIMNVQPSTVKRWFSSLEEFRNASDHLRHIFNADGSMKTLDQIATEIQSPLRRK